MSDIGFVILLIVLSLFIVIVFEANDFIFNLKASAVFLFICLAIITVDRLKSTEMLLDIDTESVNEVQQIYDLNTDFSGLEINLNYPGVEISSQSKRFNEEEFRSSLWIYQKNKRVDSKASYIKYTYYQEQPGFDEFGQSIPSVKCTLEYKMDKLDKIKFENISNQDLLKHGEIKLEYDDVLEKQMFYSEEEIRNASIELKQKCFRLQELS